MLSIAYIAVLCQESAAGDLIRGPGGTGLLVHKSQHKTTTGLVVHVNHGHVIGT